MQNAPNRGGPPSADSLNAPESVFTDGDHLVVADTGNNRVLIWNTFPTTNGQPADVVIGQATFAQVLSNRGSGFATGATLAVPGGVHIANDTLFVADSGNNRVLTYALHAITTNGLPASAILGQPDASSRLPTADVSDGSRLAGPVALASDSANLYVADRDTNRIVAYDIHALATAMSARTIFNANHNLNATGPAGLAVEQTGLFTSRLYVADTNNDQLIVLDSVSRLH